MLYKIFKILPVLMLFPIFTALAESGDTITANISDKVIFSFELNPPLKILSVFSADFVLGNPTMFYPDSAKFSAVTDEDISCELINDSTYRIQGIIDPFSSENPVLNIIGIALMPSYTESDVYLRNIRFGDFALDDQKIHYKVTSEAGTITYLRYPKIIYASPVPLTAGGILKIQVLSDRIESAKFWLVNSAGYADKILDYSFDRSGTFDFDFEISKDYSAGTYFIVMETTWGFTSKKIEIVK